MINIRLRLGLSTQNFSYLGTLFCSSIRRNISQFFFLSSNQTSLRHLVMECYFWSLKRILNIQRNIVLPFPVYLLTSWKGHKSLTVQFAHVPLRLAYFPVCASVDSSAMLFAMFKISFKLRIPRPKVLPLSLQLPLNPVPRISLSVRPPHTSISVEQPIKKVALVDITQVVFVSSFALLPSTNEHTFIERSIVPNLLSQPPRQITFPFTFILISFFLTLKYSQPVCRVVLNLPFEISVVVENVSSMTLNLTINKCSVKHRLISNIYSPNTMWHAIFPLSDVNYHCCIYQFRRIRLPPINTLVQLESWPFTHHFHNVW